MTNIMSSRKDKSQSIEWLNSWNWMNLSLNMNQRIYQTVSECAQLQLLSNLCKKRTARRALHGEMCDRPGNALSKLVFYCYMILLQVNETLINIHMHFSIDILSSDEEETKILFLLYRFFHTFPRLSYSFAWCLVPKHQSKGETFHALLKIYVPF